MSCCSHCPTCIIQCSHYVLLQSHVLLQSMSSCSHYVLRVLWTLCPTVTMSYCCRYALLLSHVLLSLCPTAVAMSYCCHMSYCSHMSCYHMSYCSHCVLLQSLTRKQQSINEIISHLRSEALTNYMTLYVQCDL